MTDPKAGALHSVFKGQNAFEYVNGIVKTSIPAKIE